MRVCVLFACCGLESTLPPYCVDLGTSHPCTQLLEGTLMCMGFTCSCSRACVLHIVHLTALSVLV